MDLRRTLVQALILATILSVNGFNLPSDHLKWWGKTVTTPEPSGFGYGDGDSDRPDGSDKINCYQVKSCPDGWSSFRGACYKAESKCKTYQNAVRACKTMGAKLASIHSREENEFVQKMHGTLTRTWIGFIDSKEEGKFVWSDGSPVDYKAWNSNEPNNLGNEDCTETYGARLQFKWNDQRCTDCLSYTCKLRKCSNSWDDAKRKLIKAKTCDEILKQNRKAASGAYDLVGPDGKTFKVYCHMTSIPGCGQGPWTLALKADGAKSTFAYYSALWTNNDLVHTENGAKLDTTETKTTAFFSPFTNLCIGMQTGSTRKWLGGNMHGESLHSIFSSNKFIETHFGRDAWKSLVPDSSLQPHCNREGFNNHFRKTRVRIGIASNQESDCNTPDSRIGIGAAGDACGQDNSNSVGNEARCRPDNGDKSIKSFGFVLIRNSLALASLSQVNDCPKGWSSFRGACYKAESKCKNYQNAERACKTLGAKLASIHSREENEFVQKMHNTLARTWIGLTDSKEEGKFVWSDGSPVDYTAWAVREPNNLCNEDCTETRGGSREFKWKDRWCTHCLPYTCKKESLNDKKNRPPPITAPPKTVVRPTTVKRKVPEKTAPPKTIVRPTTLKRKVPEKTAPPKTVVRPTTVKRKVPEKTAPPTTAQKKPGETTAPPATTEKRVEETAAPTTAEKKPAETTARPATTEQRDEETSAPTTAEKKPAETTARRATTEKRVEETSAPPTTGGGQTTVQRKVAKAAAPPKTASRPTTVKRKVAETTTPPTTAEVQVVVRKM